MGSKLSIRKDLFPGALELMVLQTLKRQSLHGYALVRTIQASSRDLLQIEEGSLYQEAHGERERLGQMFKGVQLVLAMEEP